MPFYINIAIILALWCDQQQEVYTIIWFQFICTLPFFLASFIQNRILAIVGLIFQTYFQGLIVLFWGGTLLMVRVSSDGKAYNPYTAGKDTDAPPKLYVSYNYEELYFLFFLLLQIEQLTYMKLAAVAKDNLAARFKKQIYERAIDLA